MLPYVAPEFLVVTRGEAEEERPTSETWVEPGNSAVRTETNSRRGAPHAIRMISSQSYVCGVECPRSGRAVGHRKTTAAEARQRAGTLRGESLSQALYDVTLVDLGDLV